MNGVPRVPMLVAPWKSSPVSPDISSIKKKIRARYGDQVHIDEQLFQSFLKLRSVGCKTPIDEANVVNLKRYYGHIMLLKNRIDFNTPKMVEWPWQDAFRESQFSRSEIEYEESAILYCLGSAFSLLGQRENRLDADSLKTACTNFQASAWIFQSLRDRYSQFDDAKDLHNHLLRFYSVVMLNQTQECIVEKSIIDNQSPIITAKLTKHLFDSYNFCQTLLDAELVRGLVPMRTLKDWKRLIAVKKFIYGALSNYYAGIAAESDMKFGVSVAWLKLAESNAQDAWRWAKDFNDSIDRQLGPRVIEIARVIRDVIVKSYSKAADDNRIIYHERVPPSTELEQLKSVFLAKATPFDYNDPDVMGEDIFKDLLPIETLEATSVYSEMKANYLRSLLNEVEEKDEDLESFLSTINLDPKCIVMPDEPLPQMLLDACAKLAAMDSSPEELLSNRMSALANVSVDVESDVADIGADLTQLSENLAKLKKDENLKKEIAIFDEKKNIIAFQYETLATALETAKTSDAHLHQALTENMNSVRVLLRPSAEIEAGLSSISDMINDDQLLTSLDEVARVLGKVDVMRNQRSTLVTALRVSLQADDITRELLTTKPEDHEKLFATHLAHHDADVAIIRQNLAAQEKISKALVELNARIAVKKHAIFEQRERRREEMETLIQSSETLDELLQKCDEGGNFYKQMSEKLEKLRDLLSEVRESIEKLMPKPIVLPPITTLKATSGPVTTSTFPRLGDYLKARHSAAAPTANLSGQPQMTSVLSPYPPTPFFPGAPMSYGPPQQPFPGRPAAFNLLNAMGRFTGQPYAGQSGMIPVGQHTTHPPQQPGAATPSQAGVFYPMQSIPKFGGPVPVIQQTPAAQNTQPQNQLPSASIRPPYTNFPDASGQPSACPQPTTQLLPHSVTSAPIPQPFSTIYNDPMAQQRAAYNNANYYQNPPHQPTFPAHPPSTFPAVQQPPIFEQYTPAGPLSRQAFPGGPSSMQQQVFINQRPPNSETINLPVLQQRPAFVPVGQYGYSHPNMFAPVQPLSSFAAQDFVRPTLPNTQNLGPDQTSQQDLQAYPGVYGNPSMQYSETGAPRLPLTPHPPSSGFLPISKPPVRQLPPDFQMLRVADHGSVASDIQQQRLPGYTAVVHPQKSDFSCESSMAPHNGSPNYVYQLGQYQQPSFPSSLVAPLPPIVPTGVAAGQHTTDINRSVPGSISAPSPVLNQVVPEASFSNLTISPHVITESESLLGQRTEPPNEGLYSANTNPFSDLPGHLVSLSLDEEQSSSGKRRYRSRDFTDKEWKDCRDQQHSDGQSLFADLGALKPRSQNTLP